ncbi:hypothetical protein [Mobilicoccus pelagius]|uniref:DUF5709 domain-containing protein n=1 Tax=Mobilicoccus pelagius NBRC 104925 TaxID=1089455 RepID=H5UPC5_9MICO|nr:hypothetical protein [Mobilicoccus pelagius]GAB47583.1 hypothetical protein MOPEL_021_00190 [Mobilicoccus pelagius NBRC 104925]
MTDQPTEYDDLPRDPALEDTRISSEETDDLPVSPPDMKPRGGDYLGGDAAGVEETIDERIMQEVPDPNSAYGAPDDEGGLDALNAPTRVGGDDPDAIPAWTDVLGGEGVAEDIVEGDMDIARGGDSLEADVAEGDADHVDEELEMSGSPDDLVAPEESALHAEEL